MSVCLSGAKIVTAEAVVEGTLVCEGETIAEVSPANITAAEPIDGDYIIPGIIDIHTDNLERHFFPRPNVDWDPVSAAIIHDGNCLSVGVTTVFDSLSVGSWSGKEARHVDNLKKLVDGLGQAKEQGLVGADHFIHWRCETTNPFLPELFEAVASHPLTKLLSVMDHTPGQRQYPDLEKHLSRWQAHAGLTEEEAQKRYLEIVENQKNHSGPNRTMIAEHARTHNLSLASHDDQLESHVEEACEVGATISEFPTTLEAARAARARGMVIAMGGPNLMRGGSYSGNVSAAELASEGLLDIFASDYVPRSMIEAAFKLTGEPFGWSLPDAIATVSKNVAESVGLTDRGSLKQGHRADFVRVRLLDGRPIVRGVWVGGTRVN